MFCSDLAVNVCKDGISGFPPECYSPEKFEIKDTRRCIPTNFELYINLTQANIIKIFTGQW